MKKIISIFLLSVFPVLVIADGAVCKNIHGEFTLWNGWSPALRLTDKITGINYGVPESGDIPSSMRKHVEANGRLLGKFCVVETGEMIKPPYEKQPITLVDVISYKIE